MSFSHAPVACLKRLKHARRSMIPPTASQLTGWTTPRWMTQSPQSLPLCSMACGLNFVGKCQGTRYQEPPSKSVRSHEMLFDVQKAAVGIDVRVKMTLVAQDDWDEDAPFMIPDPSASMPSGWLEDEPLKMADPKSKRCAPRRCLHLTNCIPVFPPFFGPSTLRIVVSR